MIGGSHFNPFPGHTTMLNFYLINLAFCAVVFSPYFSVMTPIDRLLKFLLLQKISAYSFERTCGVANGYLKKQERGKGSIGSEILDRIHVNYPSLNLVWLITGQGEMLDAEAAAVDLYIVKESAQYYTKDEKIKFLAERIALLEKLLADKEKIIRLLEQKAPSARKR